MSQEQCEDFVDHCTTIQNDLYDSGALQTSKAAAVLFDELSMFSDLINQCLEEPIERFIKQEQARESALLECEERLEISVDIWKSSTSKESTAMSRDSSSSSMDTNNPFSDVPIDLAFRWTPSQIASYVTTVSKEALSERQNPEIRPERNQTDEDLAEEYSTPMLNPCSSSLSSSSSQASVESLLSTGTSLASSTLSSASSCVSFNEAMSDSTSSPVGDSEAAIKSFEKDIVPTPTWRKTASPKKSCLSNKAQQRSRAYSSELNILKPPRRLLATWTKDDLAEYHAVLNSMIRHTSSRGVYITDE